MDSLFNLRLDEPRTFPQGLSTYEELLLLDEASIEDSLCTNEGDLVERQILEYIQQDLFQKLFEAELNYGVEELTSTDISRISQAHQILGSTKGYLQYFLRINYTGPDLDEQLGSCPHELPFEDPAVREKWTLDGEGIVDNISHLGMLHLAQRMLSTKGLPEVCPSALWWGIRVYFLHQNCLEEKSNILWTAIKKCIELFDKFVQNPNTQIKPELVAVYNTELAHIYAYYYDTENAKQRITKAKEITGTVTSTTGAMGKRTRHQQTPVAQLILEVELTGRMSGSAPEIRPEKHNFPVAMVLEDEDRLDKLNLTDNHVGRLTGENLHEIQHLILLAEFAIKRKYLPYDGIYREELSAYLNFLIDYPKVWPVQMTCLIQRSILEVDSRRTVERSLGQLQALRDALAGPKSICRFRVKYFYASGMCMKYEVQVALVKVLISLNLHKEALDISLSLRRWEDVISCYTNLNLRHKAEEIIREQLREGETVKLWILLGDATDNTEFYEKAWLLSNNRSARAQRQWGYYYFVRKDYAAAIPHLQASVELNPLENPTWIRLGFAALSTESWKVSTRAYQHSSTLDADNFEVWNNLGHGFIKLGEKQRALKALKEASKCNFESWKVWDNLMVVATDCKAFDEVIRCYNRLIQLKDKWEDDEVLSLLVRAIVTNMKDNSDQDCRKYLKDALTLFGRTTAAITTNPRIWKLYSDLVLIQNETQDDSSARRDVWIKSVGYSQRSVEAILSDATWSKVETRIAEALDFTLEYIKRVAEFIKNYPDPPSHSDALTKAQFTVKRIHGGIKKTRDSAIQQDKFDKYLEELKEAAAVIQIYF